MADRVLPGMHIVPLVGRALVCGFDIVDSGPLRLVHGTWTSGAQIDELGERFIFALAVAGISRHDHGGVRVVAARGRSGVLGTPGRSLATRLPNGYEGKSVSFTRATLEAHAALVAGAPLRAPLELAPQLDLTAGLGASLAPLIDALWAAERHAADAPVLLASLRDALLTTLVIAPSPAMAALLERRAPRPAPSAVARVEAYIDAHVREPIALADLVAIAGVSARSLQVGFRAALGRSPMAFLQDRRLACARADLLTAVPGTTVAAVARRLGFVALGRFSVAYRRSFGESPSQTLARASR